MVITRKIALERVLADLALEGYNVVMADLDPVGTRPQDPRLVLTPLTPRVAITGICNVGGGLLTLRGPEGQRVVLGIDMCRWGEWPLEGIAEIETSPAVSEIVGGTLKALEAYMSETDELMELDAERESRREAQAAVDKLNGALAEQQAHVNELRADLEAADNRTREIAATASEWLEKYETAASDRDARGRNLVRLHNQLRDVTAERNDLQGNVDRLKTWSQIAYQYLTPDEAEAVEAQYKKEIGAL